MAFVAYQQTIFKSRQLRLKRFAVSTRFKELNADWFSAFRKWRKVNLEGGPSQNTIDMSLAVTANNPPDSRAFNWGAHLQGSACLFDKT